MPLLRGLWRLSSCSTSCQGLRSQLRLVHSSSIVLAAKPLPPRPKLQDEDMIEKFLKGTGPGGQKINKTSSAVQLIHKSSGIVIKCQETRSRIQNRKIARQHLAERLELMDKGDESRVAMKAERAKKKKASKSKKSRRKYRKLADEKAAAGIQDHDELRESEECDEDQVDGDEADEDEVDEVPEDSHASTPVAALVDSTASTLGNKAPPRPTTTASPSAVPTASQHDDSEAR